jgi:hypothetical protein
VAARQAVEPTSTIHFAAATACSPRGWRRAAVERDDDAAFDGLLNFAAPFQGPNLELLTWNLELGAGQILNPSM